MYNRMLLLIPLAGVALFLYAKTGPHINGFKNIHDVSACFVFNHTLISVENPSDGFQVDNQHNHRLPMPAPKTITPSTSTRKFDGITLNFMSIATGGSSEQALDSAITSVDYHQNTNLFITYSPSKTTIYEPVNQ
jgi:hypothetical protein